MQEIPFFGAQGQQTLRIRYFLSSYLFWGGYAVWHEGS